MQHHTFSKTSNCFVAGVESVSVVHERGRGIAWRIWPGAHVLLDWLENNKVKWCRHPCHVVEIGAGVGLVGLACAGLGADRVTLTDLAEELPALERSRDLNTETVKSKVSIRTLRFGNKDDADLVVDHSKYNLVVVGSELIYWESLFEPIAETLARLIIDHRAVAYIGYRTRVWKTEKRFFTKILQKHGLSFEVVGEWRAVEEDSSSQTTDGHIRYDEGEWNTRVYKISRIASGVVKSNQSPVVVNQENQPPNDKSKKKPKKIVKQEKKGKCR